MYEHQAQIAFAILAACCLALGISIQRRKWLLMLSWLFFAVSLVSLVIAFAGPFYSPSHSVSHGALYLGLGSITTVLAQAAAKLNREWHRSA
jgi:drug/metabolite transporter (DMT)-like permease